MKQLGSFDKEVDGWLGYTQFRLSFFWSSEFTPATPWFYWEEY